MAIFYRKKIVIRQLVIGLCGLTLIPLALAENKKNNKVIKETLVVSDNQPQLKLHDYHSPYTKITIDTEAPQNKMAASVGDLLRNTPGVEIKGTARSNGQNINIRGFNEKGVLLMIDDVNVSHAYSDLGGYFIDPSLLKQITVIKGGNSTRYGSSALGGVVLFKTLDAKDLLKNNEKGGLRVTTNTSSVQHGYMTALTGYGVTEELDGLLSLNYRRNKDIKLSTGESEKNRDKIYSLLAKANWTPAKGISFSTKARTYHNDAEQPPYMSSFLNPTLKLAKRRTHTEDYQISAKIDPEHLDWLNSDILAYTSKTTIDQYGSLFENDTQEYETKGVKLENQQTLLNHSAASWVIHYGGELSEQSQEAQGNTRMGINLPKSASSSHSSGWLSHDLTIKPASLTLSSGIRFNRYHSQYDGGKNLNNISEAWSPSVAMTYEPLDWLMLFGSYSRSFRAPTLQELFREGNYRLGNVFLPNPDLKPEFATTKEIGVGLNFENLLLSDDKLLFKSSYFDTKAKDFIYMSFVRRGDIQSYNISQANIWGIDASANYISPYFSFNIGYNLTEGKDRTLDSWLATFGPQKFTTQLTIPIQEQLTLGWNAVYAKRFNKPSDRTRRTLTNTSNQSGYAVHGVFAYWQPKHVINGLSLGVAVDNLFNKEYRSSLNTLQDGRNVKLHLGYQW